MEVKTYVKPIQICENCFQSLFPIDECYCTIHKPLNLTMNFLPPEYKVPTNSNYMKLQEGVNRFRILSSAIVGWEWWVTEMKDGKQVNSPQRAKGMPETLPDNIKINEYGEPEKPKHFWAFVVYNYNDEKIQILELTQTGVMKTMKSILADEDWSDPKSYDFEVIGEGKGKERRYQVKTKLPKPLNLTDKQAVLVETINLEALYDGKDPFAEQVDV